MALFVRRGFAAERNLPPTIAMRGVSDDYNDKSLKVPSSWIFDTRVRRTQFEISLSTSRIEMPFLFARDALTILAKLRAFVVEMCRTRPVSGNVAERTWP